MGQWIDWGLVVVWAIVIFCFSTAPFASSKTSQVIGPILTWVMPSITGHQLDVVHLLVRKLGHLSEYFIFALLVHRALAHQDQSGSRRRQLVWTLLTVCLYAATDEWHQSFVPGRTASAGDVLLDSVGGFCGSICFNWVHRQRKKLDIVMANRHHS
jgi:VanZ family protein